MRVIVISDTHESVSVLDTALQRTRGADMLIHLGDGERELDLLLAQYPDLAPHVWHVRGNCDWGSQSPLLLVRKLEHGHTLLATHGHQYGVKSSLEPLKALARQNGADIVLFGHTHCRCSCYEDGIYFLNPGSAGCPRDGNLPSYGFVDVLPSGVLTNIVSVENDGLHW